MHRTSVIRRAALAAAAVATALAATGCAGQAVGAAGGPASASSTPSGAPASGDATASPSSAASAAGGAAPAASAPASPDAAKVLMAEGTETEQVRELQARLRQLGHFHRSPTAFYGSMTGKAVSAFQEKQGLPATAKVDGTTWAKLTAASRTPTAGELRPPTTNELDKPDERCMTGRVLCISKESRTLAWMVDGKVVSAMDVRFGSENTPTREGIFKVDRKEREWESTLYHTSMPYSMFFSGGQAVHYSSDFKARGYNGGSHGCVNVRDMDRLAAVFGQVKVGDKVVVHW
ncbi:L,D-transpeptidase family protein [Streptomyces ficellus]|uniref:Murein L,D-transpeptidase n=1 Tax=Streptomyces ficellus TaxID=1977088 RepID=A0A6I6FJH5_9ACTN|nr:L,D-transpeptidase family protein [Streptomyces ficellus]QGV78919.1 murein L,D-transpeptidase [Streptomyces ficellus]